MDDSRRLIGIVKSFEKIRLIRASLFGVQNLLYRLGQHFIDVHRVSARGRWTSNNVRCWIFGTDKIQRKPFWRLFYRSVSLRRAAHSRCVPSENQAKSMLEMVRLWFASSTCEGIQQIQNIPLHKYTDRTAHKHTHARMESAHMNMRWALSWKLRTSNHTRAEGALQHVEPTYTEKKSPSQHLGVRRFFP